MKGNGVYKGNFNKMLITISVNKCQVLFYFRFPNCTKIPLFSEMQEIRAATFLYYWIIICKQLE